MDTLPANYKNLEKLLSLMDTNAMSHSDFVKAFEVVVQMIRDLKASNETDFGLMRGALNTITDKLKADNSEDAQAMRAECDAVMADCYAQLEAKMQAIDDKINAVQDGEDGEDGKDADPADVVPLVIAAMPEGVEDTGDDIIKKINSADLLIQKDAIEGMAELEKAVNEKTGNTTRIGWGAHPVMVYHNSTLIDKNTRVINFASNLTVSRNSSGVVTVSATGGTLTELTATGTINSSNTIFTFISKPTYIFIDGVKYRQNEGWTWVGGTLTATVTKAPDYSIWGEA